MSPRRRPVEGKRPKASPAAAKQGPAKKRARKRADGDVQLAPPSPLTGAQLPLGAHPGNTGGKKGRSGRKPDVFKERLAALRDDQGLEVLRQILAGEIPYLLRGVCEHCGKESRGPALEDVVRLIPSPDTRLRGFEIATKYTVPVEKVIRLEGFEGAQEAMLVVKAQIRAKLEPERADAVLRAIDVELRQRFDHD